MDDAPFRRVHQCVGDLEGEVDRLADRERPEPLDPLPDRCPFDVLKRDEMIPAVVADREDAGDVLVVEPGGRRPSW